ncbi:hypothetical protein LTS10_007582 [Elasticomyces elasticus]|nr:hypothetical protein LTS10_007582 [Elasticomyces elasticus]
MALVGAVVPRFGTRLITRHSTLSRLALHNVALTRKNTPRARYSKPTGLEIFAAKQRHPQTPPTHEGKLLEREFAQSSMDPVATLKDRLQQGTADIETARVCLNAFYTHLTKSPRWARQDLIKKECVGSLTLQWLWSENSRWMSSVLTDNEFLCLLCYFAVSEALDNLLIDWMAQPLASSAVVPAGAPAQHRWRGSVFRCLIKGHLLLDHKGRADDALTTFFAVVERVTEARRHDPNGSLASISSWPTQVALNKALCSDYFPNTDPILWDRFMNWTAQGPRSTGLDIAFLQLSHPTLPDAMPALVYIQQHIKDLPIEKFAATFPLGTPVRQNIYFRCWKLEKRLRDQGRTEDADMIGECTRKFYGEKERRTFDKQMEDEQRQKSKMRDTQPRPVKFPKWNK